MWFITNGELADMMVAYRYRTFLARQERATMTAALMNVHLKHPVSSQDLVGIWCDGEILSKGEYIEAWKEKRRRRREKEAGNG